MTDQDLAPKPLAQINIGPTAFEEFLDRNQNRLIMAAILFILLGAGAIVAHNMKVDKEARAAAAVTACYDEVTRKYDPEALSKVRVEFDGTPAAETAVYLHALSLWDAGKTEESLKELEGFTVEYNGHPLMTQAVFLLAGRELQSGSKEKAQANYEKVAASGDKVYAPVALMTLGDLARVAGDTDKAKAYYDEIRVKYPDSSFAYDQKNIDAMLADFPQVKSPVANRMDLIGLQSPKAVAPPIKLPSLDNKAANPLPGMPSLPPVK